MPNDLDERRLEFFENVWDHALDPYQISFDERRPLTREEINALSGIANRLAEGDDDTGIAEHIRQGIQAAGRELLDLLLQISGNTRNKILTDLRASHALREARVRVPTSHYRLVEVHEVWAYAGPYLALQLRGVLGPLGRDPSPGALEALNQATHRAFVRQQRAKLMGHEAEYRLANIFLACELPFEPREKAERRGSPDAQIHGESFDLVVPNIASPRILVKSTVHTANIGQYGESKDFLEIQSARRMIDASFPAERRPLLLAFIDGIGFQSNSAGLNGVLASADEFCQFATIWKAVVLACRVVGKSLRVELPETIQRRHTQFIQRMGWEDLVVTPGVDNQARRVQAGDVTVLL